MIKVGITGGIGSGKSIIGRIFSVLGIPVYYADREAAILTDTDPEIRKALIALVGESVYTASGLNRKFLSDLIFADKNMLQNVNRIIHPRVESHFGEWILKQDSPYILFESALLAESKLLSYFDEVIVVVAPEDVRLKRALTRENATVSGIRNIMNNQLPENEIILKADHIIVNDDKTLVIPQVIKLHRLFTKSNELKR